MHKKTPLKGNREVKFGFYFMVLSQIPLIGEI